MSVISRRTPAAREEIREEIRGESGSSQRIDSDSLSISLWPPRDCPRSAAIVAAVVTLFAVIAGVETGNPAAAALVAVALVLATWRTFVPVTFVLDSLGIEQRVLFLRRRIAWAAVARCELWPDGVRLFRSASAHPLDVLRCLFIPWHDEREAIVTLLSRRALRARLFDGSGRVLIPSTISLPSLETGSNPTIDAELDDLRIIGRGE